MKDLHTLDKFRCSETEQSFYGYHGDNGNGCFKVLVNGRSFFVIASNGGGREHVSVSPRNKKRNTYPTWEEMCEIKDMFFEPEEVVLQYHPPKSDYVNNYPFCLHLWRPINAEIPMPPRAFV